MLDKMFKNAVVLDKIKHKDLKVKNVENTYEYSKELPFAPIGLDEFFDAAKSLIIAFKGNNKELIPVVILGKDKNMIFQDNSWKKNIYVPRIIRTYPFGVTELDGKKIIAVDEDSDLLSRSEGVNLFKEEDENQESQNAAINFTTHSYNQLDIAKNSIQKLIELKLFDYVKINVSSSEKEVELGEYYIINEKKLNKLNSREFKKLGTHGLLNFIYLHLNSLKNRYELI